jgi:hypothetical protein
MLDPSGIIFDIKRGGKHRMDEIRVAWAVERARKHLRIISTINFDLSQFDKKKEQNSITEAVSKFLVKRGAAGIPMDTMGFMFRPFSFGPPPGLMGSKQKCQTVKRKREVWILGRSCFDVVGVVMPFTAGRNVRRKIGRFIGMFV